MKLAKLSLAAIVAAGAMTTFANAASLEEAIKGVDISGMARYRFTSNELNMPNTRNHTDGHEYKLQTKLLIPVAENLKAGTVFTLVNADNAADGSATSGTGNMTMNMNGLWFHYAVDTFSLQAGKFAVATPWTDSADDGTVGNGAVAAFTGVPGWTFAGAAFVNTNLTLVPNMGQENLYALAAVGSAGPVGLQFWGASMTNKVDHSVFAQADFSMAGFSAGVQVNHLKLDKSVTTEDRSGFYWGLQAGYEMAGFGATVGYTQNDKDMPNYALADDDASGFYFSGGKQINGEYVNQPDATAAYIDLSYAMETYSFGAGYAHAELIGNNDMDEFYISAGYNYAKNFKLSTYFSSLDMENSANDNNRIRFEALYSF